MHSFVQKSIGDTKSTIIIVFHTCLYHRWSVYTLTFDTELHKAIPLSTAVAQQAEGCFSVRQSVSWITGIQKLITQLQSCLSLQVCVRKGGWCSTWSPWHRNRKEAGLEFEFLKTIMVKTLKSLLFAISISPLILSEIVYYVQLSFAVSLLRSVLM